MGEGHGGVAAFGVELFGQNLFVFELTSILILVAIVGAVHLSIFARRKTGIPPRPSVPEVRKSEGKAAHV